MSRLGVMLLGLVLSCGACTKQPEQRAREAMLLADAGRSREALDLLERHLREQPHAVLERRLAVRLSGSIGDLGKAERHAAALARELGPNSPIPLLELGHALELTHHYEEALEHYDRASALAARDPAGPLTGGLRAAAWGEPELAEPRLAEAARRDPRDTRAWHALGVVRARLGDLDGAERAYRSGLTADPRSIDNRVGLATVALLRDDPRAVLGEYDALLAEKPDFADAHLGRSWALVRLGRFAEASRELDRAERLGADRSSLANQRRWLRAEQSKAESSRLRATTTP